MIGPVTIARMKSIATEKIEAWAPQMRDAFIRSDDGKLKVSIGYNIFMSKETSGGLDIEATIAFVESKINDKTISTVVEGQEELPLPDRVYRIKGE